MDRCTTHVKNLMDCAAAQVVDASGADRADMTEPTCDTRLPVECVRQTGPVMGSPQFGSGRRVSRGVLQRSRRWKRPASKLRVSPSA